MSIREKTMFTIDCDRCGKNADAETDYSCWPDIDSATEAARDAEWHLTDDGKHYCWGCMEYDEETDEYKPKEAVGA